jgi:hypothetical protein
MKMKPKDLPDDTPLQYIPVVIPEGDRDAFLDCGYEEPVCYLRSKWFSGVWVSKLPISERVYPITGHFNLSEWEVFDEETDDDANPDE